MRQHSLDPHIGPSPLDSSVVFSRNIKICEHTSRCTCLIMSGIEAAGLAFGVVPIVITAARAYRTLNDRLHTLRRRHRIASRLWLKFRCIQARIRDTFRHFLAPVLQENDPWQLMQENALTAKQQKDIAAHIDQSLGTDSAAIFTEVFKEISTILDEVRESLINIETLAFAGTAVSRHPLCSPK